MLASYIARMPALIAIGGLLATVAIPLVVVAGLAKLLLFRRYYRGAEWKDLSLRKAWAERRLTPGAARLALSFTYVALFRCASVLLAASAILLVTASFLGRP